MVTVTAMDTHIMAIIMDMVMEIIMDMIMEITVMDMAVIVICQISMERIATIVKIKDVNKQIIMVTPV